MNAITQLQKDVEPQSGIYIARDIYENVLYIGMSTNLEKRLKPKHHKWEIIKRSEIEIIPCPVDQLSQLEAKLIRELKPVYNGKELLRGENFILLRDVKIEQPHSENDDIKSQIKEKKFDQKMERELKKMFNPDVIDNIFGMLKDD